MESSGSLFDYGGSQQQDQYNVLQGCFDPDNNCLYQQDNSLGKQLHFSNDQQQEEHQSFFDYSSKLDSMNSTPFQSCLGEIGKVNEILTTESEREKQLPFSAVSLELLKNYENGSRRFTGDRITNRETRNREIRKLSTVEIMKSAAQQFIQFASQGSFSGLYPVFSGLSIDESNDVELAQFLLAAAEKIGYQQYERAIRLLNQCDQLSSDTGNPVERVVYYFSEALRERIDRETGRVTLKGLGKKQSFNMEEAFTSPNSCILAWHNEIPFYQVFNFTGIQAIIEEFSESTKIHVVDLAIRNGAQWTVLMQALGSRYDHLPVESLKITAIGISKRDAIDDTGKRLKNFAETLNLPFKFNIIMVQDMKDLKLEDFDMNPEETIAVYSEYILKSMLPQPDRLDSLMKVIRSINPHIMMVTEVDANQNSSSFAHRFVESLFYYSAYFDCLEACMKRDDPNRMIAESKFLSLGIRNVVAAEGEERNIRTVSINVWREYFARFRMKEVELSSSSLYQANLVIQKFACGSSCTLELNGKSLIIGWKGTPIHSLSIWKFL
ncbi:hypothetical protein ACFE04_014196 [Oxalis oulophora]